MRGLLRIDECLVVRTRAEAFPHQRAVIDVVCHEESLNAELTATDPGYHFVFDDDRRIGVGGALLGVTVLDAPDLLTGFCIQRYQMRVSLLQKNLSVAICKATIYRVAAHYRDRIRILFRLVSPDDGLVIQIDGEHLIWKWCMHIQRIAND